MDGKISGYWKLVPIYGVHESPHCAGIEKRQGLGISCGRARPPDISQRSSFDLSDACSLQLGLPEQAEGHNQKDSAANTERAELPGRRVAPEQGDEQAAYQQYD